MKKNASDEAEGDVYGGVLERVDPLEVGWLVDRDVPERSTTMQAANRLL